MAKRRKERESAEAKPERFRPAAEAMPAARTAPAPDRRPVRVTALVIFAAAFAIRILYWRATPDREWAWSAAFKGDAPVWLDYARALQLEQPFELGLPIHPPGAAWLVAKVWNGQSSGIPFLRLAWAFLGALVPLFVFLAAERSFGLKVAALAGGFSAVSTSLLSLSGSVNNETPYLVLAVGSLWFVEDLLGQQPQEPTLPRLAAWSALNAVACLFRVEHLLFFLLALAFFALRWSSPLRRVAASLVFFTLPLVPWHSRSWEAIRRFNEEPRQLMPVEEAAVSRVEQALSSVSWAPEALRKRDELPGFARRTAPAFVLATVAYRGGHQVRGSDFAILEEAFGYSPRPLARHPFVTLYGPLNFYLANHPNAQVGFDRGPLEEPPLLTGGTERYPALLVQGLPPARLAFFYPPHLRLFNEGYSMGWRWIASNPVDFARLAAKKLAVFWAGAATSFTGWGLPLGTSGRRRAVDMVVPDGGAGAIAWRLGSVLVGLLGLAAGWRRTALHPWLLFLAARLAVVVLFFGYARQGAIVVPVLALFVALAAERWVPGILTVRTCVLMLALAVGAEAVRFLAGPQVLVDAAPIGRSDSLPADDPRPVQVSISLPN